MAIVVPIEVPSTVDAELLQSYAHLNRAINTISEGLLWGLLDLERNDRKRPSVMLRIYKRAKVLRDARERKEIFGGAGA